MNHIRPMAFIGTFAACSAVALMAQAQPADEPLPPPDPSELPPDLPPPPPPPPTTTAQPPPPRSYPEPEYPPPPYGYPPPAYGPPPIYAPPPPYVPPPREERGIHLHDGFYLRLALGLGALVADIESEVQGAPDVSVTGVGASFEFGLGGALADGFIMGGRLVGTSVTDPSVEVGNVDFDYDGSVGLATLQLFIDVYPLPSEGFHVLAALGPGSYSHREQGSEYDFDNRYEADGWVATAGVGWEGWVGEQWGLGAMLSLHYGGFEGDSYRDATGRAMWGSVEVLSPSLLFTATYN